jgi:hypothetical protein
VDPAAFAELPVLAAGELACDPEDDGVAPELAGGGLLPQATASRATPAVTASVLTRRRVPR